MSFEGHVNSIILKSRLSEVCDAAYEAIMSEECVNPDLVAPLTLDSYEIGFRDGLIIGGAIAISGYFTYKLYSHLRRNKHERSNY